MRRIVWATVAAMLVVPAAAWSQQADSPAGQQQGQASNAAAQTSAPAAQSSLAEAARQAREQKKDQPKSGKVFTNDNMPTGGGISSVGAGTAGVSDTTPAPAGGGSAKPANDEKAWREKFAQLRHKLEQDQAQLDVMQRELGVLNTQFYPDPVKGMQQELTRSDINQKIADIDRMKAQIQADQQAIDDAEEQLRKSGGSPGWAR